MSWYRDYKEQWKEIIETVVDEEHEAPRPSEEIRAEIMELEKAIKGGPGNEQPA